MLNIIICGKVPYENLFFSTLMMAKAVIKLYDINIFMLCASLFHLTLSHSLKEVKIIGKLKSCFSHKHHQQQPQ